MMLHFGLFAARLPESQGNMAQRKTWEQEGVRGEGKQLSPSHPVADPLCTSTRILQAILRPGERRGGEGSSRAGCHRGLKPGEGGEKGRLGSPALLFGSSGTARLPLTPRACQAGACLEFSPGTTPPCFLLPRVMFQLGANGFDVF